MGVQGGTAHDFAPNPYAFFAVAGGPDISDLAGPPADILDIYADGTPMAQSERMLSNAHGGGMHTSFLHRGDVHAFLLMLLGGWIIHRYASS